MFLVAPDSVRDWTLFITLLPKNGEGDGFVFAFDVDDIARGTVFTLPDTAGVCTAGEVLFRISKKGMLGIWTSPVLDRNGRTFMPLVGRQDEVATLVDLTSGLTVRDPQGKRGPTKREIRQSGWVSHSLTWWHQPGKSVVRPLFGQSLAVRAELISWADEAYPESNDDTKIPAYLCSVCGSEAREICSACQESYYCGKGCQKTAWAIHKCI